MLFECSESARYQKSRTFCAHNINGVRFTKIRHVRMDYFQDGGQKGEYESKLVGCGVRD